ncbi:hypothetical protein [Desulfosediminicola flagellatus]|uniref:hypothetical protein n=1 Tax=Desulfosediminicola flagellatus TaxID=2569541 RepID=UPI0010AD33D8|nr:hypothetical protein [Desulfosediminicola flagellatus]
MLKITLLAVVLLCIPSVLLAESGKVRIGDPKELFLTERAGKEALKAQQERGEPQNIDEFLVMLKKDFGQIGGALKEFERDLKAEIIKQNRNTFSDPDFIQPERPDWR